jgi:hypothetical protein
MLFGSIVRSPQNVEQIKRLLLLGNSLNRNQRRVFVSFLVFRCGPKEKVLNGDLSQPNWLWFGFERNNDLPDFRNRLKNEHNAGRVANRWLIDYYICSTPSV